MDYFENGSTFVAIYFLSASASAAVAATKFLHISNRTSTNVVATALLILAYRTLIVGAGISLGLWFILMFVFPAWIPLFILYMLGNIILALAVIGLATLATYYAFSHITTLPGVVSLTLAMAVFYIAVAMGMNWLNDYMHERAASAREAKEIAKKDRAQLEAVTLETREEAMRKRIPLQPHGEPYTSLYSCVEAVLTARSEIYRAEQRWSDNEIEKMVAGIPPNPNCRVTEAITDANGGVRVTTEDETLPPWGKKVAKEPEPYDPPLPPLQLYFLPVTNDDGTVRWLCTAPYQSRIATRFVGCGYWTPSESEWAGLR